jgi:hypothetical protein
LSRHSELGTLLDAVGTSHCAVTGSQLIADNFVGANHLGMMAEASAVLAIGEP